MMLYFFFGLIALSIFGLWLMWPRDLIYVSRDERHDHSTDEFPWDHPEGYPYEVMGGKHDIMFPEYRAWSRTADLEGYSVVEDAYSDRLYLIPSDRINWEKRV